MDLADARATALAWSIPRQAPRIERAGYLDAASAIEALRAPHVRAEWFAVDEPEVAHLDAWLAHHGGPLIMVELSQLGMDILGVDTPDGNFRQAPSDISALDPWLQPCLPVQRSQRYSITAFFDPRTGLFLGHQIAVEPEALWAAASPKIAHRIVTATPSPRRAPYASPHATPRPLIDASWLTQPLGAGEYPVGVREMVHVWPLVEGSSWVYRATSYDSGREWRTYVITETVTGATRLGSGAMLVQIHTQGGWWSPWAGGDDEERLVLNDRVATGLPSGPPLVDMDDLTASVDKKPKSDKTSILSIARLPLGSGQQYNYWWRTARSAPVTTHVGRFDGCLELTEIFNAGNVWGHWLCTGVGIVRHELPGCSGSSAARGGYTVMELIGWSIPPMKAVP